MSLSLTRSLPILSFPYDRDKNNCSKRRWAILTHPSGVMNELLKTWEQSVLSTAIKVDLFMSRTLLYCNVSDFIRAWLDLSQSNAKLTQSVQPEWHFTVWLTLSTFIIYEQRSESLGLQLEKLTCTLGSSSSFWLAEEGHETDGAQVKVFFVRFLLLVLELSRERTNVKE